MQTYNYTIFPVDAERLTKEIEDSNITIVLDHISILGSSVDIVFVAALPVDDEATLAAIAASHTGEAYPPPVPTVLVTTLMERDDKALRLACKMANFVGNTAEVSIKIPGDFGSIGRYVAGGYGFTNIYYFGDRITKVEVVDKDFAYAGIAGFYAATPTEEGIPGVEGLSWADIMPNGVVIGRYHDTDVETDETGWFLWCEEGNQGGVDIDPLGGYGTLPAQTYLVITFEKDPSSAATKAIVDLWWGKEAPIE